MERLDRGRLGARDEDRLLAGRKAVIAEYSTGTPPRVLYVHGMLDAPIALGPLAAALDRSALFLCYDDATSELTDVIAATAHALAALPPPRDRLDIVAHSLGGIVMRAALNLLADQGRARGGFHDVRLVCIDTPWDGFVGRVAPNVPWLSDALATAITWALRRRGGVSLDQIAPASPLLERLCMRGLSGVRQRTLFLRQRPGFRDGVRFLDELSDDERAQIVTFLKGGEPPALPRARMWSAALICDSAFAELRRAVLRSGALDDAAYATLTPMFGNHRGALKTAALAEAVRAILAQH